MRRNANSALCLLFLCPPCFALGLVIGGCRPSARDDFLLIRSVRIDSTKGDASAYQPARTFPGAAPFGTAGASFTRVPEE